MLIFDLLLASADDAGAGGLAVGSGAESGGCVCAFVWSGSAGSDLALGSVGATKVEALSVLPAEDSIFGSGLGMSEAGSSGCAASLGAGGGGAGVTAGGIAAGPVFTDWVLRAVAAGCDLALGANWVPYGLTLGMCGWAGPPEADLAAGPLVGASENRGPNGG
jgi:hypothetical protein